MGKRREHSLELLLVFFGRVLKCDSHAEIGIGYARAVFGIYSYAVGLALHVQQGSRGIRRLCLDVAAIDADIGEGHPGADVASVFANLRAALALVARAPPLFHTLIRIAVRCRIVAGDLAFSLWLECGCGCSSSLRLS